MITHVTTFPLTIDYSLSRAEMVAATGCFPALSRRITEDNFPVSSGDAHIDAVLVQLELGRSATDKVVSRELHWHGLRDATMDEGLAFGAQFPEEQLQDPVVFRGSVWTSQVGYRYVGSLWEHAGRRFLSPRLDWHDGRWPPNYRFLAVPIRQESPGS